MLNYTQNSASLDEITSFLWNNSSRFSPPLTQRVNICSYAAKLKLHAHIFEAKYDNKLVGFIAVYLNRPLDKIAYVSLTCCDENYLRQGITTTLHQYLEESARMHGFTRLHLQTDCTNVVAQKFYKKLGYTFLSQNDKKIQLIKML